MQKLVKLFTNLCLTELSFYYLNSYIIKLMQKLSFILYLFNRGPINCISRYICFFIFYTFASEFNKWVMNWISADNIHYFLIFLCATHWFFPLGLIVKKVSYLYDSSFMASTRSWTTFSFNLHHLTIFESWCVSKFLALYLWSYC